MDNVTYRLATAADAQLAVDMRILFLEELTGKQAAETKQTLRESLVAYFRGELDKNYLCWYATLDGKPVSIAGMVKRVHPGNAKHPSGVWGYIMSVYTVPEHRGKGFSKNIMQRLTATARERGITAFELHATKDGLPLYVKEGFVVHSEPTMRRYN